MTDACWHTIGPCPEPDAGEPVAFAPFIYDIAAQSALWLLEETLGKAHPPIAIVGGRVLWEHHRAANAHTELALLSRTLLYRFIP